MKEVSVSISKWAKGSGFSYNTDADPMHIDEDQDFIQAAHDFVETWVGADESIKADLKRGDDYQFTFTCTDGDGVCWWASDIF